MDKLNLNKLLNREEIEKKIIAILTNFQKEKANVLVRRGIYLYGNPGAGKTYFVRELLKKIDHDGVFYDAGDIRNKSIIDTITKHNMADKNILSMFFKKPKHIAIIMDEIDGMNSGDKGGINSLIKLIRPKKTKKQKTEEITSNPIICIGNYHIDKKIKELMKVCHSIELKTPTKEQIEQITNELMPSLDEELKKNVIEYSQGDLRKLQNIYEIYANKHSILKTEIIQNIFQQKSYNDDTKKIMSSLIVKPEPLDSHLSVMNETDRTIVGLLWHENIIDTFNNCNKKEVIEFYYKVLNNMCLADYVDRITFQKQIWQFNEMSSLIKTFYNNHIYHNEFSKKAVNLKEPRFTKVLTKYSTEYNNYIFIQNLCQQLSMDKKDVLGLFLDIRNKYSDHEDVCNLFENYDIGKLDINRIYRYIDKYTKLDQD